MEWIKESYPISKLKVFNKDEAVVKEFGFDVEVRIFNSFLFSKPIYINTDGTILFNHEKYAIMKSEHYYEVSVLVAEKELSVEEEIEVIKKLHHPS